MIFTSFLLKSQAWISLITNKSTQTPSDVISSADCLLEARAEDTIGLRGDELILYFPPRKSLYTKAQIVVGLSMSNYRLLRVSLSPMCQWFAPMN